MNLRSWKFDCTLNSLLKYLYYFHSLSFVLFFLSFSSRLSLSLSLQFVWLLHYLHIMSQFSVFKIFLPFYYSLFLFISFSKFVFLYFSFLQFSSGIWKSILKYLYLKIATSSPRRGSTVLYVAVCVVFSSSQDHALQDANTGGFLHPLLLVTNILPSYIKRCDLTPEILLFKTSITSKHFLSYYFDYFFPFF
jgi:hypothetical protein